jgi:glycosyltransferase involved in cell wall biosynthesis
MAPLSFLNRLGTRSHAELPKEKVVSFSPRFLWERINSGSARNTTRKYDEYLRLGALFGTLTARHLARDDLSASVFFGFNTGCLEVLEKLRGAGLITIVDQIDPARVEEDLVRAEAEKWPGWEVLPGPIPAAYYERLAAEWHMAQFVLVNSEWSRRALIQQGVPAEKLLLVPIAYDPPLPPTQCRQTSSASIPLSVLWLGSVTLRKGIQYLIQAARMLPVNRVRFHVIGPIGISQKAVRSAPENVEFLGPLPRNRVAEWYRRADLFVLPTLSDGFAITQLEAMAHGLPVITTPNCGEVVTDGVDGRIVPPRDAPALISAIADLASNREFLRAMSVQAVRKARQFSLDGLVTRLSRAINCALLPMRDKFHQHNMRHPPGLFAV